MSLAQVTSLALVGLVGHRVEVQADVGGGLPGMVLLGLPDASLNEARDRVRAAARNSGAALSARRITVNLVPAALPKRGPGFDVAILLAALAADGRVSVPPDVAFLGEVGLDGGIRPLAGVLPAVLAARGLGIGACVVPEANAAEAALVPGVRVIGFANVAALLRSLGARFDRPAASGKGQAAEEATAPPRPEVTESRHEGRHGGGVSDGDAQPSAQAVAAATAPPDLREVVGQPLGRHAVEVAAAGGHHLLLLGPPGSGKTMLAERLPGLLPPLGDEDAIAVSSVHSLAGRALNGLVRTPPFESPHHGASTVALVGGGSGIPRPGAASRAHGGVLFLDEAPEFSMSALDSLREPLESGSLTLHRAAGTATYPARFQLVLAANPCPCGKESRQCTCTPLARRRYWARLSGPLLDRLDLRINVPAVKVRDFIGAAHGEDSATVRARVVEARRRQRFRWAEHGLDVNARVPGALLRSEAYAPRGEEAAMLKAMAEAHALTGRGVDRVLRVAWTLADLADKRRPGGDELLAAGLLRGSGSGVAA